MLGLSFGFFGRVLGGAQTFTIEDFSVLVALIAGGVLANFIASWGSGPEALLYYVIALAVGFVFYLADPFGWFPDPTAAEAAFRRIYLSV